MRQLWVLINKSNCIYYYFYTLLNWLTWKIQTKYLKNTQTSLVPIYSVIFIVINESKIVRHRIWVLFISVTRDKFLSVLKDLICPYVFDISMHWMDQLHVVLIYVQFKAHKVLLVFLSWPHPTPTSLSLLVLIIFL